MATEVCCRHLVNCCAVSRVGCTQLLFKCGHPLPTIVGHMIYCIGWMLLMGTERKWYLLLFWRGSSIHCHLQTRGRVYCPWCHLVGFGRSKFHTVCSFGIQAWLGLRVSVGACSHMDTRGRVTLTLGPGYWGCQERECCTRLLYRSAG